MNDVAMTDGRRASIRTPRERSGRSSISVFGSVVFTDPTNASVLYRVGPTDQCEIGRVVVIDDAWRVASGTVCRDLADANYVCPGVTPDPPPGPLGGTRIPVGAGG